MNKKYIVIGIIVVAILGIFVGMMVSSNSSQSLGADRGTRFPHGITIGNNGDAVADFNYGTCNLTGFTNIAASSTATGTCAATGVAIGDKVVVQSASSTPAHFNIVGSSAKTDAIDVTIYFDGDITDSSATPATITTGVKWFSFR